MKIMKDVKDMKKNACHDKQKKRIPGFSS